MASEGTTNVINNRYRLDELLGKGSMGQVYRATDCLSGQAVALKRVADVDPGFPTASAQITANDRCCLAQEFLILTSLVHPHIISVFDFDFDDVGQPFYTMDYLHGAQSIVTYGQEASLGNKIDRLQQMFEALAYLHGNGILHRDLKPGNVLVTSGHVRLLDFGLSITRERFSPEALLLQGTAAYLAPELYQGAPPSEASDIYACGIIAYEYLAGRHPFDISNMNRLMLGILYEKPDIDGLALDASVQDFLGTLLELDPQERPAASAAVQKLQEINGKLRIEI